MFFIKLRWSSLGLIHMSAWTNFQLWSWVSNEKPKQTMEEWQSVAEFYTNYSNASIYLFNQFGELKWQFSSFLDPPQWPHTWFPLRVSISYRLNNHARKKDVNLKHWIGQKFDVIVLKTAHRRSDFLKTLISQEIFASIGLGKNLF